MLEKSRLFAESWNVAWRKSKAGTILSDKETEFHVIKNSFRYWTADPFVFEYKGKAYIFAELYDYIRRRGILGYCMIGEEKWRAAIVEDYHMSYPFIFQYNNNIYIMPEANASDTLYFYRAITFPDKWEKCEAIRSNVKFADTSLLLDGKNKKYALTYDVSDPDRPSTVLLDFENPENDQVLELEDIQLRRPAGRTFRKAMETLRPAQYCIPDYGKGLVFYSYRIDANCKQKPRYYEQQVQTIFPQALNFDRRIYLDGMHTYNYSDHYEVIDIKTRRFNALNLLFRCLGKICKR